MEQFFSSFVHAATWVIGITLVFAVIGVYATIRWLVGLVTGAEQAVVSDVKRVESTIEHR